MNPRPEYKKQGWWAKESMSTYASKFVSCIIKEIFPAPTNFSEWKESWEPTPAKALKWAIEELLFVKTAYKVLIKLEGMTTLPSFTCMNTSSSLR